MDQPKATLPDTRHSLPIALLRTRKRILAPIRRVLAQAACLQPASISRLPTAMMRNDQIEAKIGATRYRQLLDLLDAVNSGGDMPR